MAGTSRALDEAPTLIAEVAVDTSLVHLDKVFDYSIPIALRADVQVGSRVRVRFAGSLVNGWVLHIKESTSHQGRLLAVERVPGAVPPLSPTIAELARQVASRYAGTLTDVLRAAVPTRHATTENSVMAALADSGEGLSERGAPQSDRVDTGSPIAHTSRPTRTLWLLPAGTDHLQRIAERIVQAKANGGVIAVMPDATDVAALVTALKPLVDPSELVVLTADSGPAKRWRAFLLARLGQASIVVGTRACVFAPLEGVRTILLWDDADDSHREAHAPYWHAREVAVMRSSAEHCDLVLAGRSVSIEAAHLAASGWLTVDQPDRATIAVTAAAVKATKDDSDASIRDVTTGTRIPSPAMTAIREGLSRGSVLISVPRRGFVSVLSCAKCRETARCSACHGFLGARSAQDNPACSRCGWNQWRGCGICGNTQLRAVRVGADRTADEIGKAFPGFPIVMSNGEHRVTSIPRRASLVVATHGCEPFAGSAYSAVVILDVLDVLNRPSVDAEADALRRFANAIALAGPGAPAIVVADSTLPIVQALIRRDYLGWARRELEQREAVHMPPSALMFSLTGPMTAVPEFLEDVNLPQPHRVLGPMPVGEPDLDTGQHVRALVVVPRRLAREVVARVREVVGIRGARKAPFVRVVIDPSDV